MSETRRAAATTSGATFFQRAAATREMPDSPHGRAPVQDADIGGRHALVSRREAGERVT